MNFKEIKNNYPVYIFDKDAVKIITGKAVSVSLPRLEMKSAKSEMVVDITIDAEGKSVTYTIPESVSIAYAGNLILSVDKEGLAREVEAMRSNAENVIASADKAKLMLEKIPELLADLKPEYRERQINEQRFDKIENAIANLSEMMKKISEQLT